MSNSQQSLNDNYFNKIGCILYSLIVGLGITITIFSFLFFIWYDFRKETIDHFDIHTYQRAGSILAGMVLVFITNYIFDKLFGWYPLEQLKLRLSIFGVWFWSAVILLIVI